MNELPTEQDADRNGDVMGYHTPSDYAPVPFRRVRRNPQNIFIGWRKITPSDYKHKP